MRQIDEGVLGRVLHVDLAFRRGSALTRKTFTWRDNAAERFTSGALGDLGVHLIDLLHHLFDSEVDTGFCQAGLRTKVAAKEGRTVCVDDHAFVSGRLTGGPHFTLTASKSATPEDIGFRVAVTGTRGELLYHSQDGPVLNVRTGVEWEAVKVLDTFGLADPPGEIPGWADSFVAQFQNWTAAVGGTGGVEALVASTTDTGRSRSWRNCCAGGRPGDRRGRVRQDCAGALPSTALMSTVSSAGGVAVGTGSSKREKSTAASAPSPRTVIRTGWCAPSVST